MTDQNQQPPQKPTGQLDLRPPVAPPATAAPTERPAVQLPGPGVLPLTAGQVVSLTPAEEEAVKKLHPEWQPGDPVPSNLGQALQAIQHEAQTGGLPVDPSTPPIDVNKLNMVNIDDLPPERQAELRQAMSDMMAREQLRAEAQQHQIPGADPALNAAIQQASELEVDAQMAERAAQQPVAPPTPPDPNLRTADGPGTPGQPQFQMPQFTPADVAQAMDTAPPEQPAPQPLHPNPRPPFQSPPVYSGQQKSTDVPDPYMQPAGGPAPAPPPPSQPQPASKASSVFGDDVMAERATQTTPRTGATAPAKCAHCGWDPNVPDTLVPTDADKYAFMAAVLGGQRFFKDVELLGGKVIVKYRTLLSQEASQCLEQVAADAYSGAIRGDGEWWRQQMLYRLACGIETITIDGRGVLRMPPLAGVRFDQTTHKTALPPLVDYLFAEVLPQENVRRFVGREFLRFQKLTEKMEARLDDSDFWKGTEGPPS